MSTSNARSELVAGVRAVAPMIVGVVPFGLVAGATPTTAGLGGDAAIGLSTLLFAGASQLAAADVLAEGGAALVAVVAACTINLRMLLYSASLAPFVADVPLRRRLLVAYFLTDQSYAVSITRWTQQGVHGGTRAPSPPAHRLAYYFGGAALLWVVWQICTILGVLVGNAVPDSLPLDFAVPLVFLVMLIPAITSRPAAVAAIVGGLAAVGYAEAAGGHLGVLIGALAGIVAGAVAEAAQERRAARAAALLASAAPPSPPAPPTTTPAPPPPAPERQADSAS